MILPDLVGMTMIEARQVLVKGFPEINCKFQTYLSPRTRNREEATNPAYLVIRQKAIGENTLELIISPFSMMNE